MFFFRFSTRNSSTTVGTVTISLIVSMVDRYNVLSETRQYHGEHPSRAKCAILHRLEEGCGVRYWILIQYRTPLGTNVHNIAIPIKAGDGDGQWCFTTELLRSNECHDILWTWNCHEKSLENMETCQENHPWSLCTTRAIQIASGSPHQYFRKIWFTGITKSAGNRSI